MKFYHSTTYANWEEIQKDGILYGKRGIYSGCTYLAVKKEDTPKNEVLLEVEYNPNGVNSNNIRNDNYCNDCWQFRVYIPISIQNIKRII